MGTTADKLQAVMNSKNAIKTKLGLADNVPFSQYADNINPTTDFYQCVDVYTPDTWTGYKAVLKEEQETVETEGKITVSGCGYEAANGTYSLEDSALTGQDRAFIHDDNELIKIHCPSEFQPRTWIIEDDMLYVVQGGTEGVDNPANETEWYDVNEVCNGNLPSVTWSAGSSETKTVKYYEFEEELTTDTLTYGNGFTPVKDGIYDATAMVKVKDLWMGNHYQKNETVFAVQSNSYTGSYTATGFYITSDGDGTIDWGDGTTADITSGESVSYEHDYGDTFSTEHIVRIKGDAITAITSDGTGSKTSNAVTRVIQFGNSLTTLRRICYANNGLTRIEDTVQIPEGVTDMSEAFKSCSSLTYAPASLRFPTACTNYNNTFYSCYNMIADITHWFDNFANIASGTSVNMYYAFCMNNVGKVTGTLPANLLWNNSNLTYSWTSYAFYRCTKLTNYSEIPSEWGGE